MSKLLERGPDRIEHRTSGTGLALAGLVVGSAMVGVAFLGGGAAATWNAWTWGMALVGLCQIVGGALLLWRGPTVWGFDLAAGRVEPPARGRSEPFELRQVEAVVVDAQSRLAPSLLLLSCEGGKTHTLDVGGSLERSGLRLRGRALASRLGVPFIDRTTPLSRGSGGRG